MSYQGFRLVGLRLIGADAGNADLLFDPSFTFISGATSTGKTLALECIDYMLGAKDSPRPVRELQPFDDLLLGLQSSSGIHRTLRRPINGGRFRLIDAPLALADSTPSTTFLAEKHHPNSKRTISSFLLELGGFSAPFVMTNASNGKTRQLSFRDVADFVIIRESMIFKPGPLFLSGQYTEKVVETSTFRLLLTGHDEKSKHVHQDSAAEKTRISAQAEILDTLIADVRRQIDDLHLPNDVIVALREVEVALEEATRVVARSQDQLAKEDEVRQRHRRAKDLDRRKLETVESLLGKFELLEKQYDADLIRLEALAEANSIMEHYSKGRCPLCGTDTPPPPIEDADAFASAIMHERTKIMIRYRELQETISHLAKERTEIRERMHKLDEVITASNNQIDKLLRPQLSTSALQLGTLLRRRSDLEKGRTLLGQVENLNLMRRQRNPSTTAKSSTRSAQLEEHPEMSLLCDIMKQLLVAWNFPGTPSVEFDYEKQDFVIFGTPRSHLGKGFLAISYAAFAIGLMLHCQKLNFPHPGFVVLDSPLVTYQRKDVPASELLPEDIKDAFIRDLAQRLRSSQVIVFDNEQVPPEVQGQIAVYRFTGNPGFNRSGFLPVAL